jgi:hypothetical protein
MLFAREKRKENIAEYILYMWQIEDIIRAYQLDIEQIEKNIISGFNQDEKILHEIREWYDNLIRIMKNENIEKAGHCQFLTNLVNDMNELHLALLNDPAESMYQEIYKAAQPNIIELQHRSKYSFDHEIDTCLHGLYGLLLLKLQKREITSHTLEAFSVITKMMATLAAAYKKQEHGNQKSPVDPGLN